MDNTSDKALVVVLFSFLSQEVPAEGLHPSDFGTGYGMHVSIINLKI